MADEPTTDPVEPTGDQPAEPDAPAQEQPKPDEPKPADPKSSSDGIDWKAKARQWEDRAKENKKAADQSAKTQADDKKRLDEIAKLLGLKAGEEVDPAKLAEQLTSERDKAAGEAAEARLELAVFKAADKHGADPSALLDSRDFLKDVGELDASDKAFSDDLAGLIKQRVKDNPTRYAREPAKQKKSGSGEHMNGGAPAERTGSLHAAVAKTMNRT